MEVRWGFVGAGNVTEWKASPGGAFTQDGSRVVAVARSDLARGEAYARANGIARAYASVAELCADPEVDAVFVCTPHYLHQEHALAAIAAGKHVLCEKPLTITTEDGIALVEAAKRVGVVLAAAYYRRFYPVLERLHEIVAAGRLGTLTSTQMVCRSYSIPPEPPADASPPTGWRTRADQSGGGALTDVGSHRLDLLFWLLGDSLSVSATVERIETWLETEDQANVTIRFTSRATATLDQSFCSRSPRDSIVVYGTEGIATVPDLEGTRLELETGRAVEVIETEPRAASTHRPLVTDFVRALNGDGNIRCSGADALRTTQIIELAYRAARAGRTLDVPALG